MKKVSPGSGQTDKKMGKRGFRVFCSTGLDRGVRSQCEIDSTHHMNNSYEKVIAVDYHRSESRISITCHRHDRRRRRRAQRPPRGGPRCRAATWCATYIRALRSMGTKLQKWENEACEERSGFLSLQSAVKSFAFQLCFSFLDTCS